MLWLLSQRGPWRRKMRRMHTFRCATTMKLRSLVHEGLSIGRACEWRVVGRFADAWPRVHGVRRVDEATRDRIREEAVRYFRIECS